MWERFVAMPARHTLDCCGPTTVKKTSSAGATGET